MPESVLLQITHVILLSPYETPRPRGALELHSPVIRRTPTPAIGLHYAHILDNAVLLIDSS